MNTVVYKDEWAEIAQKEIYSLTPESAALFLEKFRPAASKKSGKPRTEREEQLDIFLARLNASRITDGYPKITYGRLAKMLEGIPTGDLHAVYKKCESYRSFGAGLHYELKPRV